MRRNNLINELFNVIAVATTLLLLLALIMLIYDERSPYIIYILYTAIALCCTCIIYTIIDGVNHIRNEQKIDKSNSKNNMVIYKMFIRNMYGCDPENVPYNINKDIGVINKDINDIKILLNKIKA